VTIAAISPETAIPADDEAARRARYAAGLRVLAVIVENHPEVPLPFHGAHSPLTFHFLAGNGDRERMAAAARALPCTWRKGTRDYGELGGAYFDLTGDLAGLKVQLTAAREDVCERIVTGTREVTEMVKDPVLLAAIPLVPVTREVEEVEWRCRPVTAPAKARAVKVTADPAGIAAEVAACRQNGNGATS
jgi:hypothetical protein